MRFVRAALMILVLLAAVGAVGPWRGAVAERLGAVVDPVRRIVSPRFEPVNPVGAVATAELPGEIGVQAVDGFSNTAWAAPGEGPLALDVTFAEPVEIGQVGITNGAPGEAFRSRSRPRVVRVIAPDGAVTELELADTEEFQTFAVDAPEATSLRFEIITSYPADNADATVISEIEFFRRE